MTEKILILSAIGAEEFTLFWNGPFSQWYSSPIKFEGMDFNCAEQFMMFCKAMVHDDIDSATEIMRTEHPGDQKKLGRKVKNFNVEKWANVAQDVVYTGSYNKFTQDEDLKKTLQDTEGTTLVEASPYDKIWGIGLTEFDPLALRRETWDGKNWLGVCLDKAKDHIKNNTTDEAAFKYCVSLVDKYRKAI